MEIAEKNWIKALAALTALNSFRGAKNELAVMHCLHAAEDLALHFEIREALAATQPSEDADKLLIEQALATLKAAKQLGLFRDEPAGYPDAEWIERIRLEGGDDPIKRWFAA